MNKKFSTLVASLLLASGVSSVNAETLAEAAKSGQFYYLQQIAKTTDGGTNWSVPSSNTYVIDASGKFVEKEASLENYWKVSSKKINGFTYYELTNCHTGKLLTYTATDGTTVTAFQSGTKDVTLNGETVTVNTLYYKDKDGCVLAVEAQGANKSFKVDASSYRGFDLVIADGIAYTAEDLNDRKGENAGFNITIGDLKEANNDKTFAAYSSLQGNALSGTWFAIPNDGSTTFTLESTINKSNDNKVVVLKDKWSEWGTNHAGSSSVLGYKLAALSTKADNEYEKQFAAGNIVAEKFQISSNVNDGAYVEVLALDATGNPVGELYVAEYNGVKYLTLKESNTSKDAEYNTSDDKTYVKLGADNLVDWTEFAVKDAYYTIINAKTGDVYGTVGCNDDKKAVELAATEVQATMPEGMWAFQYGEDGPKFVNRESQVELDASEVAVYSLGNNVYQNTDGTKYTITAHAIADLAEGYGVFVEKDVKYNLGVYSPVWKGTAYFAENHADSHQIGLDTDVENATAWTLTANDAATTYYYATGAVKYATDSIYVINQLSYYDENAGWKATEDTMKIVSYSLTNAANGESLGYNSTSNIYACKESASNFIFKKVGDTYNMIEVDLGDGVTEPTINWTKVYGGDSATDGLLAQTCAYERTENDLISVTAIDAPEYLKLNMGDVIKIFRSEYADEQSNVLYEKGKFLGVGNAVEFAGINPALYVDTAYTDSYRPEYLLAVDVEQVLMEESCEIPGHPHAEADTLFGRFLVSFADSAILKANIHANEWLYDGEAKLGFVEGFHTANNLELPATKAKIGVRTSDPKFGKYAFRIVDNSTDAFVIETAHKVIAVGGKVTTGYIRIVNGNVVVTTDINEAEVFNLTATDQTPTANEAISAAAVTVVAGEGNVTIAGAAGKKVVIANILGQTIANTVLTSDNATIAAPAGVVVVAVEGEAAVKAIVK